jgi:membrane protein implicated in regulation of membrane protease activity
VCRGASEAAADVLIVLAIVLLLVLPAPLDVIVFAGLLVLGVLEVTYWWRTVRGRRVETGAEALIGSRAKVLATCRPDGEVWVDGARWSAHCEAGADTDAAVTVVGRDGLLLIVEPR